VAAQPPSPSLRSAAALDPDFLAAAFEHVGDALEFSDTSGTIISVNAAFEHLTGYSRAEVVGRKPAQLMRSDRHPTAFFDEIWNTTVAGEVWKGELWSRTKSGDERRIALSLAPVQGADGSLIGFVTVRRDVTQQAQARDALQQDVERYALAAAGAVDGLWAWDLGASILFVSPRFMEQLGEPAIQGQMAPEDWLERVHPEDRLAVEGAIAHHLAGTTGPLYSEYRVRQTDGSYRWVLTRGLAERNEANEPVRLASSQSDITERKQAELQLRHDALHDALTDLPNRALLEDRLLRALRRRGRRPGELALLFIDFDRFKNVNDSLGHAVGDALLREMSGRLLHTVREVDTVARLSGDEFVVLLEELKPASEAVEVAKRIQAAIGRPFRVVGQDLVISTSIGVAIPRSTTTAAELLRDADTAMYRAKAAGPGNIVVFEPSMRQQVVQLVRLESDLRQALQKDQLHLQYQPIYDLERLALVAFEALVRWRHPDGRVLAPGIFLPVAKQTGQLAAVETWVLERASRTLAKWRAADLGVPDLRVWVNLSPDHLARKTLVQELKSVLEKTGLPPDGLQIEITEEALMGDAASTVGRLKELRALGIRFAVDDFGTGYSSLSYLQRFPLHALKIDKSFVRGLGPDQDGLTIVRAIMGVASGLGLRVVAEGIETTSDYVAVRDLGCQLGQGFGLGRPMDEHRAIELMRSARPHLSWFKD
jgi:diguanylate cyclase (GGDEF)-like protein/PAS domain S-box-containing protein